MLGVLNILHEDMINFEIICKTCLKYENFKAQAVDYKEPGI